MNKIICVDNENALRLLFSSTNTDVKDGDQILIKKNITLSDHLFITKAISIAFSKGVILSTGEYKLKFKTNCAFY